MALRDMSRKLWAMHGDSLDRGSGGSSFVDFVEPCCSPTAWASSNLQPCRSS